MAWTGSDARLGSDRDRGVEAARSRPGSAWLRGGLGGVDAAFECVGAKTSHDMALRIVRAGGQLVVSGIPGGGADLIQPSRDRSRGAAELVEGP